MIEEAKDYSMVPKATTPTLALLLQLVMIKWIPPLARIRHCSVSDNNNKQKNLWSPPPFEYLASETSSGLPTKSMLKDPTNLGLLTFFVQFSPEKHSRPKLQMFTVQITQPRGRRRTASLCFAYFSDFVLNPAENGVHLFPPFQLSGGCELTVVMHDFVAGNGGSNGELTVRRGQTVEVLERLHDKPDWCLVRTTDRSPAQEGIVPCSILCIAHSRSSMEMEGLFNHKGRS